MRSAAEPLRRRTSFLGVVLDPCLATPLESSIDFTMRHPFAVHVTLAVRPILLITAAATAVALAADAARPSVFDPQLDPPVLRSDAPADADSAAPAVTPRDAEVATWRTRLLDVAFDGASRLPLNPHAKNRARAQAEVVDAALAIDLPVRARLYADEIANWRRGAGLADVAMHLARSGVDREHIDPLLDASTSVARTAEGWRQDRIRVKVASVLALRGDDQESRRLEAGVTRSEAGKVAAIRAEHIPAEALAEQLEGLRAIAATGDFDLTRNALTSGASLYRRFFDEPDQRALIHEAMRSSWSKIPLDIRISILLDMADVAIDAGDPAESLRLEAEAGEIMSSVLWQAETEIPLASRRAGVRGRAGDLDAARAVLLAQAARFDADRRLILKVDRADMLRAIAEGYARIGDVADAQAMYRRALEVGADNANGRPRVDDLTAILTSMVKHDTEPDTTMHALIETIHSGLSAPW